MELTLAHRIFKTELKVTITAIEVCMASCIAVVNENQLADALDKLYPNDAPGMYVCQYEWDMYYGVNEKGEEFSFCSPEKMISKQFKNFVL